MKIAVLEPRLVNTKNIIRDVIYGCWCGGKRIGGASVPPFEQLTIATVLEESGHDVVFIDAQAEQVEFEEVLTRIKGSKLLVCSTSVMTMKNDALFIKEIKQRIPGIKVAAYGSHPTFLPEDTLEKGIDFAIQREPEAVIKELANRLDGKSLEPVHTTLGVVCYDEAGNIVKNKRHPFIEDLDQIPRINLDFLPKNLDYFNPIVKNLPYLTISTSHGCPAKCSFCTAPFFHGTQTRFMSANKVVSDAEYYLSQGIREMYFRDETFTADRKRVLEICAKILERGMKFSWICNARVDTVDYEMLIEMKKAGCHLIKFGVESGNQKVLNAVKKGITLPQIRNAFRWCQKVGIATHGHFMVGMPEDTLETMEDTLNLAIEIAPTTATFGICTPYPGTPLFREVVAKDSSIGDGTDNATIERLHVQGAYNHLYSEVDGETLHKVTKRFYRRFYLRPTYLMHSLLRLRNLNMVRNAIIGGSNVFSFATDSNAT